jgi:hypothetical protein
MFTNLGIRNFLKLFLPLWFVLTFAAGISYAIGQQNLRQGANDPQVQIAQDGVTALNVSGNRPPLNFSNTKIDMSKSYDVFIITFDKSQHVTASSGILNGTTPSLPSGALDNTKKAGESNFTWQPQSGVRIAAVAQYYNGPAEGYVLVGRSLKEVEKREDALGTMVLLAWLLASFLLGVLLAGLNSLLPIRLLTTKPEPTTLPEVLESIVEHPKLQELQKPRSKPVTVRKGVALGKGNLPVKPPSPAPKSRKKEG